MNSISVFALLLCAAVCYGAPEKPITSYPTKYDDVNIDEILNSKRLLSSYVKCLTESIGCTPQGTELRKFLPDALQTNCTKCSEKQKKGAIKIIKTLEKDHPNEWKKLLDKWDPDRKLFESFKKTNHELYVQIFEHN